MTPPDAPTGPVRLPRAPRPAPLDPPMVPFAVGGMIAWAVAGLVCLLARNWLADTGRTDWLWTCLAGFLLGLPGLAVMLRHDANRRRRHADQVSRQPGPSAP
ncbi:MULTISPECIES: DUF2530 domain-containing protein [unclassified Solwaraspora]|uniref:DUF2530 domain-containing protein n=1 Tax=unclassified Solwaraspora TaxID=2627926 RepID=UPI00248BC4C0|nr:MULTISPECIES: DUF2530 domain-containing protein [unclassified Solwaraspora]WBC00450.1 DUF2530 domain-containing protein [Solwaraspora sp. WMMA2059]WBC23942.1 DUF2530 domain-containing protein [Solwaraspora sp. WMMA2080]WJK37830.1 DUF2530 domain-containing protein [Solwaraspora sp. WMMA2065]